MSPWFSTATRTTPPRPGEFDGIRKKVGDGLREPIGIHVGIGLIRFSVEFHAHTVMVGISPIVLDHLRHQGPHLDPPEIEHDVAGLDLFDIEDIVDEASQSLTVGVRDGQQSRSRFRHVLCPLPDEQAERPGNRGQRRPQLVADGRNELVLQALCPPALADVDEDAQHHQFLADTDRIEPDLDGKFGAVLAPSGARQRGIHAAGFRLQHELRGVGHVAAGSASGTRISTG